MPRAKSAARQRAFELWAESGGKRALKDIAEELGVSPEQVRKWKSQDKWKGNAVKVTLPKAKGHVTKRKGGQPGNKNAVGNTGGAPVGNKNAAGNYGGHAPIANQNAVTHGAYSRALLGCMDEDEQAVMQESMDEFDPLEELKNRLRVLKATEIRLTKYIAKLRAEIGDAPLLESRDRQKGKMGENVDLKTRRKSTPFEGIVKLEAELNKVHKEQNGVLQSMEKLAMDRKRMEQEQNDDAAAEWLEALLGEREDVTYDAK